MTDPLKKVIRKEVRKVLSEQNRDKDADRVYKELIDGPLAYYMELMRTQMKRYGAHKEDVQGWMKDIEDIAAIARFVDYEEYGKAYRQGLETRHSCPRRVAS